LFFYPGLFLPLRRWLRPSRELHLIYLSWFLVVLGLALVYSRWWSWYGGFCWGPRFFLFAALPCSLGLALWSDRVGSPGAALLGCVIVAWSFWVGFNGLVFALADLDVCAAKNYRLELFCWYVPEFSPLIRPFVSAFDFARELVDWERGAVVLFLIGYIRITYCLWVRFFTASSLAILAGALQASRRLREFRA
jgi:hypothetical protein